MLHVSICIMCLQPCLTHARTQCRLIYKYIYIDRSKYIYIHIYIHIYIYLWNNDLRTGFVLCLVATFLIEQTIKQIYKLWQTNNSIWKCVTISNILFDMSMPSKQHNTQPAKLVFLVCGPTTSSLCRFGVWRPAWVHLAGQVWNLFGFIRTATKLAASSPRTPKPMRVCLKRSRYWN